jgi:DNA-directed RNA polymerase specialized sigma24 family protein
MPDDPAMRSPPDDEEADGPLAGRDSSFPITQWSLVLRAGTSGDAQFHAALESLCRRYWYPIYTFARRQGRDHHAAEDCTQEFLARLLAGNGLSHARPERGRFRSFLLMSFRNFLTSDWRHAHCAKRGGGVAPAPLGATSPDEKFRNEPADLALTPEQAFDRSWALSMIDQSIVELRRDYQSGGRAAVFDALAPLIWGDAATASLAQQAARANLTVPAFTVALHRARKRLGERLRLNVAATVDDVAEIDTELRHLVGAIGARPDGR